VQQMPGRDVYLDGLLGRDVEACANGGALPALFSASDVAAQHGGQVRIWEEWESVLDPKKSGHIPSHVVVTSGYNPKKDRPHYALICHSNVQLTLVNLGNCDLTGCLTFKNKLKIKYIIGARLLVKQHPLITPKGTPSALVRRVAFEASLVGHCYVKLKKPRLLNQRELNMLQNYQASADWLRLVNTLRP
jgi:hypothetical protein